MSNQSVRQIAQHLEKVGNILIVVGGGPSVDSMGSALALFLSLSERGKRVQVVTQNPIRVEHSRLVGCDKVETSLGSSKSFVISLPHAVDSIEKVSCYAEGKTLNIVLQPYADVNEFDPTDIQYSKASGSFDTIILVDVASRQEAQKHLAGNANLLNELPIVAIGRVGDPTIQMRYLYTHHSATAQGILELFAELGITFSADVANNLLQGIYEASDDFHAPNITPQIFEDASKLLKVIHGALGRAKSPVSVPQPRPQQQSAMSRPSMPIPNIPRPAGGGFSTQSMPRGTFPPNTNTPMSQQSNFPRLQAQPNVGGSLPPLPSFPRSDTQPSYGQPAPSLPSFNQPNNPFANPNGRPNVPNQNFGPNELPRSKLTGYPSGSSSPASSPQQAAEYPKPQNKIGTNQEWEVDPFYEFDKAPDEMFYPETMQTYGQTQAENAVKQPPKQGNQPKMPGRETFQSQTSPRSGGQGNQGGRRNNPNRQGQNRPNAANQPKGQNQKQQNPEDGWLAPKIYKTEDLL